MSTLQQPLKSGWSVHIVGDLAVVMLSDMKEGQVAKIKVSDRVGHQLIFVVSDESVTGGTIEMMTIQDKRAMLVHLSQERITSPFIIDIALTSEGGTRTEPVIDVYAQPRVSVTPADTGDMPKMMSNVEFEAALAKTMTKLALEETLRAEFATEAEYQAMVDEVEQLPLKSALTGTATWASIASLVHNISGQAVSQAEFDNLDPKDFIHYKDMHMFGHSMDAVDVVANAYAWSV